MIYLPQEDQAIAFYRRKHWFSLLDCECRIFLFQLPYKTKDNRQRCAGLVAHVQEKTGTLGEKLLRTKRFLPLHLDPVVSVPHG
jgi:hypothetical protein